MVKTLRMPFFAAHSPSGAATCGSVKENRATYGDLLVMIDVAAFMMSIGFFASVAIAAAARAFGVRPKPARMSTPSCVTSSCARRLATSGAGPVTFRKMTCTFLPPATSPCWRR